MISDSEPVGKEGALRTMLARHAVLITPTSSSRLSSLLSRRQSAPLTPLGATLMDFPASVANKRLTSGLSPLAATLTKNGGVGLASPRFGLSDVQSGRGKLRPYNEERTKYAEFTR